MSDTVSKSWFCVFNNPGQHGYTGTPEEILERLKDEWVLDHPTRTGAWIFCVSAEGLEHVHMVLEDEKAMRFSAIKKTYAIGMHFEPTKGDKDQAEDYINKRGKWQEKGEKIIASVKYGEIKGRQGQGRDIEVIEQLIKQGMSPNEIYAISARYIRYENVIKKAYLLELRKKVPLRQDVCVYWHYGASGCGKSYSYLSLVEKYGRDKVYMVSDYENGFLDNYCGEPVLFLDEFRGHMHYTTLLVMLDGYTTEFHARYQNVLKVWNEVHITSVKTPYEVYQDLVYGDAERKVDTYEQLCRRINYIVYHWKDATGYRSMQIPMPEYRDRISTERISQNDSFVPVPSGSLVPFEDKQK